MKQDHQHVFIKVSLSCSSHYLHSELSTFAFHRARLIHCSQVNQQSFNNFTSGVVHAFTTNKAFNITTKSVVLKYHSHIIMCTCTCTCNVTNIVLSLTLIDESTPTRRSHTAGVSLFTESELQPPPPQDHAHRFMLSVSVL